MRRANESEDVSEVAVIVHEEQRRIMLIGDLTPVAAAQVIHALLAMNDADQELIELWIHSGGGSPSAASAICDVMQYVVSADILTVGMGLVCSAATLPLLLGDHRLVFPNTEVMIHGASRDAQSEITRADVRFYKQIIDMCERTKASLEASNRRLVNALIDGAGWSRPPAEEMINDGLEHWFFGGKEIVEAGFADAIMGQLTEGDAK